MMHFPSSPHTATGSNLNATQRNALADPQLAAVHDELHDARRVHAHGQEDDLRAALDMVIKRVETMSKQLSAALHSQAETEVQLNVAKSNLQLVIANNEMLEEALSGGGGKEQVGWRRSSSSVRRALSNVPNTNTNANASVDRGHKDSMYSVSSLQTDESATGSAGGKTGFFKSFRFGSSAGNGGTASAGNSRPGTPHSPNTQAQGSIARGGLNGHSLNSPSMPTLPLSSSSASSSPNPSHASSAEMEALRAKLADAQKAHTAALADKAALEEELESLSQALFEEANKMVKVERIRCATMEEELREVREEREALRGALKLVGRKEAGLGSAQTSDDEDEEEEEEEKRRALKRSSSRAAVKSPPPPDRGDEQDTENDVKEEGEGDKTFMPPSTSTDTITSEQEVEHTLTSSSFPSPHTVTLPMSPPPLADEPSPWADVPSSPKSVHAAEAGAGFTSAHHLYALR